MCGTRPVRPCALPDFAAGFQRTASGLCSRARLSEIPNVNNINVESLKSLYPLALLADLLATVDRLPVRERALACAGTLYFFALATVGVVFLLRRRHPGAFRSVNSAILSPVGGIFALTASFLIADVWNKNATSLDVIANETHAVHQILNIAVQLPAPLSGIVTEKMNDYRRLVLLEEAPRLSEMRTIDTEINGRARKLLYEISASTATRPEPVSSRIFDMTNNIFKYRNQRMAIAVDVTQSRRIDLTTMLAFFLIFAVAATHSETLILSSIMTVTTATIASIVICFAIYNGKPFDTDVSMLKEGGFFSSEKDIDLIAPNPPGEQNPPPPIAEKSSTKRR